MICMKEAFERSNLQLQYSGVPEEKSQLVHSPPVASGEGGLVATMYSHFINAVKSAELTEFEKKLQEIKDLFGIESTSTVFQKMVNKWAELHWKAQIYDQLRDTILGFEAYHEYEMGESEDANGRTH